MKVLVAVSNLETDMGYVQGLHAIAGVLLFFLEEEEAFWAMVYFLHRFNGK